MSRHHFALLYGSRNPKPIDKGDVILARIALFAVQFTIGIIFAFALLLLVLF